MDAIRQIEVTTEQVADMSRDMARSFGHENPDLMVIDGPLPQVRHPFCGRFARTLYVADVAESLERFPLWMVYTGAVELMLAKVGPLADVAFVTKGKVGPLADVAFERTPQK